MSVANVTPVFVEAGGNVVVASSASATAANPSATVSVMAVNLIGFVVFIGKGFSCYKDNLNLRRPTSQKVSIKK
jgi:hypothetical protein